MKEEIKEIIKVTEFYHYYENVMTLPFITADRKKVTIIIKKSN